MAFLFLALGLVGAILDWRYVRAGGLPPTKASKLYLGIAVALCVAVMTAFGLAGAAADAIGQTTALLGSLIFALWELGRFRVRRANRHLKTI